MKKRFALTNGSAISGFVFLSAFCLFATANSQTPSTSAASTKLYGEDTEHGSCKSLPDIPLFQQPTGSEALDMDLITSYEQLTASTELRNFPDNVKRRFQEQDRFLESRGYYPGVLRIVSQDKREEYHPVMLHVRGHSRAESWVCGNAPPLKVFFLDKKIKQEIDEALMQDNIPPSHTDYLKLYYDALVNKDNLPDEKKKSPTEGIFANLGSELKLVTHCDAQTGEDDRKDLERFEKGVLPTFWCL